MCDNDGLEEKNRNIVWGVSFFPDLSNNLLYKILQLRSEVFVVEQNAVYQDIDGKDEKALHLYALDKDIVVAYCRLFRPGHYFDKACIGRVIVSPNYRRLSLGHDLMNKAVDLIESEYRETEITISAQLYLKTFYESHGFCQVSDIYQEDGIPHIRMCYAK